MVWLKTLAASAVMVCLSSGSFADDGYQNHFASILLDGKKIGHVQYTIKHDENGELEELRTKASLSMLGVKLYDFSQQLQEQWAGGELQSLTGDTNDDGKRYAISLTRTPKEYDASLNDKPLTLPHGAFPISLWHYAVTQQTLLFDLSDLTLLNVSVTGQPETVDWNGKSVEAERFVFVGDWEGTVWFDDNKDFLKAQYISEKRQVTVVMDP